MNLSADENNDQIRQLRTIGRQTSNSVTVDIDMDGVEIMTFVIDQQTSTLCNVLFDSDAEDRISLLKDTTNCDIRQTNQNLRLISYQIDADATNPIVGFNGF